MKQNGIIIGFSEKYFTLWNVFGDERRQEFQYVKNISMNLDVVREKYPDVEIDYTLRGTSWIVREKKEQVEYEGDVFQHGRYIGLNIVDCKDYDYMFWYYSNCANEREQETIMTVLEPVGYRTITHVYMCDGEKVTHHGIMTPEEAKHYDEIQRKFDATIDRIKNEGTVEVTVTTNAEYQFEDDNYTLFTEDKIVVLVVDEAKEQYYNGYTYYLPVINGKAKRLKNKTVTFDVKKYTIDDVYRHIYVHI